MKRLYLWGVLCVAVVCVITLSSHNVGAPIITGPVDLSGAIKTSDDTDICAMVLANGQHMFSCDGQGSYALKIPLDTNGQFKLQVYADGFAPTIQVFDKFQKMNNLRMARAVECQP